MFTKVLRALLKKRGWSQYELARRIGVSRQAVSLWMKQPQASVRSGNLLALARALGVKVETLVEPVAALDERHGELRARYLWDGLFPDLDDFAIALNRFELPAVARLVQVDGLYAAAKVLGRRVWTRFDDYKPWIQPVRRELLESLVRWRENQKAA